MEIIYVVNIKLCPLEQTLILANLELHLPNDNKYFETKGFMNMLREVQGHILVF